MGFRSRSTSFGLTDAPPGNTTRRSTGRFQADVVSDNTGEESRARNEVAFRDANDKIKAVIDDHDVDLPLAPFLCECGDRACRQLIRVPLDEYREVRESPRRFILARGHDQRDGKETSTIAIHEGFVVVEKAGIAGEIAEERAGEAQHG